MNIGQSLHVATGPSTCAGHTSGVNRCEGDQGLTHHLQADSFSLGLLVGLATAKILRCSELVEFLFCSGCHKISSVFSN